ncbi:MAG TPA: tRNA 2-thiocytidine biosynthesis protein TtcA [Candidatus Coproplasma excrementigallinarum]|uniref:tRNA 2-thiocytidine biosynthesis protein TtcA n=1 Tax=Candidatus Coproplasma excrementigallinarum TaxID=2840747 RepID=A0A9D1SHV9_9FIRM|nr:tRNA 2-thiocytidine biosynthesis protein TtcA [Candidatus Coproplasma excrementigallinarum]
MIESDNKAAWVERSIITKFRKTVWAPFLEALKQYKLISAGDKVAVCVSGGKDSMLLAKLFQELQKHSDYQFGVEYICMNPGYNAENLQRIKDNAALLNVPLKFFSSDVFEAANLVGGDSPCYMCARMRRGCLYAKAKELGCNKIALGHHRSDVIETTLMGMFYGGQIQGMMPRIKSANFEGMELIRPMYCISEEDIEHWRDYNGLEFIACACSFTQKLAQSGQARSVRQEMKELIKELKKRNPDVEKSIFKSLHNVQLDTLVEYKTGKERHSFLEKFEK